MPQSHTCERYSSYKAIREAGYPPGAFCWTETYQQPELGYTHLYLGVPLPANADSFLFQMRLLRVYREGTAKPKDVTSWEWDGDEDKPTLKPSIGVGKKPDGTYTFHGWLTAGILEGD